VAYQTRAAERCIQEIHLKFIASKEDVASCYRLILGREPDPTGLQYFTNLAKQSELSAADVAILLTESDEFALRGGRLGSPTEVSMGGYYMFARAGDRDIGYAIAKGGAYEPHVTGVVKRELRRGNTFVDVGANIGYFSMLSAHLVGVSGKVIAIEPLDKNLQLIYAGIQRNGFKHVDVYPFGASDDSRIVGMVTDPGTSNALIQSAPSAKSTSSFIATRTLDWITRDLERADLLKMDIEGHELLALRGAAKFLERCRPKILIEFHPLAMRENAGVDAAELLKFLFEYGRELSVVVGTGELIRCTDAAQVMAEWKAGDKRYGGNGTSHLDLFIVPN
jgi:FkbM family methyltransferase